MCKELPARSIITKLQRLHPLKLKKPKLTNNNLGNKDMKNIHIILATILFISIVSAQEIIIMDQDVTYNSAGFIDNSKRLASGIRQGGKDITATGILRLPIVFVRFADDNNITTHWPVANQCPS